VLLSSRLSEMLDRLPEQLQETAAAVRRLLVAVASGTAAARADAARGQHMARRLLEQTADALSAALLLEQAGHDLARGDGRAAAVARRYVGRRVLHEQPEIAPALAESVLFYEPVPA